MQHSDEMPHSRIKNSITEVERVLNPFMPTMIFISLGLVVTQGQYASPQPSGFLLR